MYMIGYVFKTSDRECLFLQLFRNLGVCSLVIWILCPWEQKTSGMDGSNKCSLPFWSRHSLISNTLPNKAILSWDSQQSWESPRYSLNMWWFPHPIEVEKYSVFYWYLKMFGKKLLKAPKEEGFLPHVCALPLCMRKLVTEGKVVDLPFITSVYSPNNVTNQQAIHCFERHGVVQL